MKIGHVSVNVRKYADGRWGFDDYSSGKRVMVRYRTKHKADARATDVAVLLANGRPPFLDEIKRNGFAPVPPPILRADQIRENGEAIPNKSGIYFIWEGPLVAYIGQTNNLARRLLKHPHLQPSDRISFLCIDSSDLFYHEAFYIGICRPLRNFGFKSIKNRPYPTGICLKIERL